MFKANKIVLVTDIVYDNVTIFQDLNTADLPSLMADGVGFSSCGCWYITNLDNIVLVQLDKLKRTIPGGVSCERLVISGSNVYHPAMIINRDSYGTYGIPNLFDDDQLAFSCPDGLFITQNIHVNIIHLTDTKHGVRCGRRQ